MKPIKHMTIFAALLLLVQTAFANHLSGGLLFSARFSGDQEVPVVDTDATGVGGFFLNAAMDTLCISIDVNGLSGPIMGAHIHEGMMGMNGGVLVDFTGMVDGNAIRSTITGDDLTPELIKAMLMGGLYFNIHTEQNPGGEIRGQILLEADMAYTAMLDADQETAEVNSPGLGLATFNLSKTGMKVNYRVVVDGLTGQAAMAHLHLAPAGQDGPVVVNLTDGIDGNVISGSFDPTEFEGLLEAMNAGEIYINVHTAQFPGGEVRGQLMLDRRITHDAYLDVAQESPEPMGADGNGLAIVRLNYTLDTLFYDVQVEGLTGAIMGAHFHEGEFGMNGGVLIDLTADIDGNRISGHFTGEGLNNENIQKFLSGGIYINVHTAMNMAGEIRGQVYKLAREGYTFDMSGMQEVPAVETAATGSGIVSIDRDQTNAHFMLAYNDLSGPTTIAHFHMAAAGANGGVIFDLGPFLELTNTYDAAFGYWTDADDNAFDAEAAMAFRNNMVYANIHTAMNPGGEIRGQVTRSLICSSVVSNVFSSVDRESLSVYPNPSHAGFNIDMVDFPAGTYRFELYDITGKLVDAQNIRTDAGSVYRYENEQLLPGVYVLSIAGAEAVYTTKLIRN